MRKYSLLYLAFIFVALLGVLNFAALSLYLYWTIWWFDNVMHFLGGFSLGFFSLYIFYGSGLFGDKVSFSKAILISFVFVMILGGIWEVFEYINGLILSTEKYSLDVAHDLLADALGAISALWTARQFLKFS
ncbi:MAG: hypothetical protein A3C70_01170 [Candidatus Zambryskibacteria bacterium RIFCSPHIGHO2_02_FULL_43_14]|uniref:VanZ-like domain-containing protein n=1 Tax=Candidatus Zambryskibacteria bacterium RIFCSPHIGHO2_02_FULL_43_14 TaxID=1802748 RepID=A0A1G2TFF3_9BACT|nr:MAG: hypothetical protein A2829_00655 [Candidatus Zambryskibacteria bacterium RIFCSPHIGHO2_01_FULL_43_60]OHA96016.1 MAG: hypothetical protein A3C70_01170 [Candidatus Zambryskibacteria bacterium RIFCSPHIGHO2_02_FULL_43_14]OHB03097.1 MAG: hypothetical protein A3B03_01495 [Candidatus Zambryskibacteria bacterium RIFCSPLOWO2_01_FULL_42_41]